MKPNALFMKLATGCAIAWVPLATCAQIITRIPERFGVIDVTPNNFSGENNQNSEPSLAVGLNGNYGKMMVHAFTRSSLGSLLASDYYTASSTTAPWANGGPVTDFDATLDWSPRGTCYMALIPALSQIQILKSSDPTTTAFSAIPSATITKGSWPNFPDQPWIKVVNVTNEDHIFVGYNDLSVFPGKTATVRFSMDSGATWNESVVEKVSTTIGWDSPAIRLATSPDGTTVYALFQRSTNFLGQAFRSDFKGEVVLTRDDG